jgi:N-acetylglucosamine kinase-like BadF-type ATPase
VGCRYGVVLIAGTGTIAYGVNGKGQSWRADGWGFLAGDEGSAYWIGVEALHAVTRAHDGRGPETVMSGLLLSHLGLEHVPQLVPRIYGQGFGVPQVAGLAPRVAEAARAGDEVARAILEEAGRRLVRSVRAVIDKLGLAEESFEVVLTGGVLRGREMVWERVAAQLAEIAPQARAIAPRHDAAYGAALLARQGQE